MPEMNHLRCPRCLSEVEFRPDQMACSSCGTIYPMKWDIPLLADGSESYLCPAPAQWMSEQLDRTRDNVIADPNRYFLPLLQEIIDHIPDKARKPIWIENLVDESRAVGKYLTAMRPEHHVLNLGSCWDNTTINMARTVRRVTTLDPTLQRLQLLALKKRYYGLGNIDLFCGDETPHLPFADDSFDAVFLNGTLGWSAPDFNRDIENAQGISRPAKGLRFLRSVYTKRQPNQIHKRLLKEVRRVLKETGEVFIAIENRYSRDNFGGRPTPHSTLRFGSIYPRLIADLMSLVTKHRSSRTFTDSLGGYRSLLSRVGLPLRRVFSMEPEYLRPAHLIDLSCRRSIHHFSRGQSTGLGLMPAWLYRQTAPSFGMVGTGGGSGRPWIARVVDDFGDRLDVRCRLQGVNCNRKGKLLLTVVSRRDVGGPWLIKVPVSPTAQTNCQHHFEALSVVRGLAGAEQELSPLLSLLPEPVHLGELDQQSYFAETMCSGRPWSDTSSKDGDHALWEDLCRYLTLLGRLPMKPLPLEHELSSLEEKTGLLGQQAGVENSHRQVLQQLRTVLGAQLKSRFGRTHLRKGDFSLSNVMVAKGKVTGLIDFDEWGASSDPLVDGADFLLSWLRHRKNRYWIAGLNLLGPENRVFELDGLSLDTLLSPLGLTVGDLERSALMAWLDHAWHACHFDHLRLNRRWFGRMVLAVLESLEGRLDNTA